MDNDKLLEITSDRVGVIRNNSKWSFPSDNSTIRSDKYNIGQRRIGESQIIKDNFVFGISERQDFF